MPRLALTTTSDRVARLTTFCREAGLEPISLPCIEFVPVDEESLDPVREEAGEVDWIVVTSSRAVTSLWPDGAMPPTPVAAVGPSTAAAVRHAGGTVEVIGQGGSGDLVMRMEDRLAGHTVLYPHVSGVAPAKVEALQATGATVRARPVYEVRPIPPESTPVDAVVFGSPTAVAGWCMTRGLEGLALGVIGETTAAALAERSASPDVMPPRPSFERLIQLIADHLSDRSAV